MDLHYIWIKKLIPDLQMAPLMVILKDISYGSSDGALDGPNDGMLEG